MPFKVEKEIFQEVSIMEMSEKSERNGLFSIKAWKKCPNSNLSWKLTFSGQTWSLFICQVSRIRRWFFRTAPTTSPSRSSPLHVVQDSDNPEGDCRPSASPRWHGRWYSGEGRGSHLQQRVLRCLRRFRWSDAGQWWGCVQLVHTQYSVGNSFQRWVIGIGETRQIVCLEEEQLIGFLINCT